MGDSAISSYKRRFANFCEWLEERAKLPLEAISPVELKRFRAHLIETSSPSTATRKLKAIKAMFKEAQADGYCLVNPAHRLEVTVKASKQVEKAIKRPFTIEGEIKLLLDSASEEWRRTRCKYLEQLELSTQGNAWETSPLSDGVI